MIDAEVVVPEVGEVRVYSLSGYLYKVLHSMICSLPCVPFTDQVPFSYQEYLMM